MMVHKHVIYVGEVPVSEPIAVSWWTAGSNRVILHPHRSVSTAGPAYLLCVHNFTKYTHCAYYSCVCVCVCVCVIRAQECFFFLGEGLEIRCV